MCLARIRTPPTLWFSNVLSQWFAPPAGARSREAGGGGCRPAVPAKSRRGVGCGSTVRDGTFGWFRLTDRSRSAPPRKYRVLHVIQGLLPLSETFIQQQMFGRLFEPYALTWVREKPGLLSPCPSVLIPLRDTPPPWARTLGQQGSRIQRKLDILRVLRDLAPDIVHAHFGPPALRVDRECRALGIPLVVTFYGGEAVANGQVTTLGNVATTSREFTIETLTRAYRRLFVNAAAVAVEGPALARKLMAMGARPGTVKLLPLTLPPWAMREPKQRVAPGARPFRLVQIARFVEKKGIDITLRALAAARLREPNLRLVLIGDGPLRGEIEGLIRDLRLADLVERPGFVPYAALPDYFAACHVLIQPSRTARNGDSEGGAPAALTEAQAQGVPVLATRNDDLPSVMHEGVTGLLADENDVDQLARNILRLAGDPELLEKLGRAARAFVLRRHDSAKLLRMRERIYLRAMKTREVSGLARIVSGALGLAGRRGQRPAGWFEPGHDIWDDGDLTSR